eukprot:g699.t1
MPSIDELSNSVKGQVYKLKIYRQVKNKLNGLLPLHVGLINHASIDVAERLYDIFPEGVEIRDKYGRLPIHCAIIGNVDVGFVKRLYSKFPKSLSLKDELYGYTPLHYAVKHNRKSHIPFLLTKYSHALNVKAKKIDENGDVVVMESITSTNIVNNTNNTSSNQTTALGYNFHAGDTPIDIAKKNHQLIEIYQMLYDYQKTIESYVGENDERVDL